MKAGCVLDSGVAGEASVPSGASTGAAEALELRDGDRRRYRGLGCRKAVMNILNAISDAVCGRSFDTQGDLDQRLIDLDGTDNKRNLGANAMLAVSIAFARAVAAETGETLYAHFARLAGSSTQTLPRLTVNLFSGNKHAGGTDGGGVAIQDVLLVPGSAASIDESLATVWSVYQHAAELCAERFGSPPLTADEGGLAPPVDGCEAMIDLAVEAMTRAGYEPGRNVAIALDIASSHFYRDGVYTLDGETLDSESMIERLGAWVARWPIVSVEDGLAEDDWEHWPSLRDTLSDHALTLGDDLLCTNPARIERAIDTGAADALLLKVNQIGTLTESAAALKLARDAGWQVTVSARSGETEDNWLADLAVGFGGDQIKIGSITQSERLAKYNRLLEIERETDWPVVGWPRR